MNKKFLIITLFFTSISILTEWGFRGYLGAFSSIANIIFIAAIITMISKWLLRRPGEFQTIFIRNALIYGSVLGVFSSLLLAFSFYSNTFPGSLSAIHLSNGTRKIIFFQMSHIGTKEYYTKVQTTLKRYTENGYTIYYEGVLPGTKESQEKFDQALGVKISSGTYARFAGRLGLVAQDDQIFRDVPSEKKERVDISLDQIVGLLGTGQVRAEDAPSPDPILELDAFLPDHTGPLLSYMVRGVLNFSLSYLTGTDMLLESLDTRLREAILGARNRHLVDRLIAEPDKNIVIVYGALHFDGVYALLRSQDPLWKIESLDNYFPYND